MWRVLSISPTPVGNRGSVPLQQSQAMRILAVLFWTIHIALGVEISGLESRIAELETQLRNCKTDAKAKEEVRARARKEASKAVLSCDSYSTCQTCSQPGTGCGWCLGERACVPDEAWMCQGEEDHVGVKVGKASCPAAPDDPKPQLLKATQEVPPPPPPPTTHPAPASVGNGICTKEGSGCFGQAICTCSKTFPEVPHRCACGQLQSDMQGCCNCQCGSCDEICAR